MKKTAFALAAACAAFALAAGPAGAQPASAPAGAAMAARSSLDRFERKFIDDAAAAGAYEIAAGKLAAERGSAQGVKDFGNMLVKDHTQAAQELSALASGKGHAPDEKLDGHMKRELDKLGKLQGTAFDAELAKQTGVKDHEATIKKFENASKKAKDADLKAWVDKTLPALRGHLDHARQLHASLGVKK